MNVFVWTAILGSGACHRSPSSAAQPDVVEPSGRRFAGVDIVPTSRAGFVVRIHSGMVGRGDPLYVIDGAPMQVQSNRGIDWFTPDDIVDIKVLKTPQELSEYGSHGVNGVVVITTKQNPARRKR
jgi:outer membrane receptor for ferrienterochelin and colicin